MTNVSLKTVLVPGRLYLIRDTIQGSFLVRSKDRVFGELFSNSVVMYIRDANWNERQGGLSGHYGVVLSGKDMYVVDVFFLSEFSQ